MGRYGCTALAAFSVTRTSLATSTASEPSAAPSAESVIVERKSAIAATPSIETVMKAMAPRTRSMSSRKVSGAPDSDVMDAPGCSPAVGEPPAPGVIEPVIPPGVTPTAAARDGPRISTPAAYEVTVTATTASVVNAVTETSLASSSLVRPTGRASR